MIDVIESDTFRSWVNALKDRAAVARINARLRNVSLGNTGDTRTIREGIFELRIHYGPGYRLYCLREANAIVVLCGGKKNSQQRDVERAGRLARLRRKE